MKYQALLACDLALPGLINAQISLGSAATFGILGATTVTNTGLTVINGDLGVSPGTAITEFPPGVDNGKIQAGNAVAAAAQADATKAYKAAVALAPTQDLTGKDLGGMVLSPGKYHFSSSAQLNGILTLNANGNANAHFVFQIGSTLTTASAAVVRVINGAQPCNIFWQIGSSATIGTGTKFTGNVVALTAITVTTGSSNNGSFIALNAAVTLDTDLINSAGLCGTASPTPSSSIASSASTCSTSTSTVTQTLPASTVTQTLPASTSTSIVTQTLPASTSIVTQTLAASTSIVTQVTTACASTVTQNVTKTTCPITTLMPASSTTSSTKCYTTTAAPSLSVY